MISSVVARLTSADRLNCVLEQLAQCPQIEVGQIIDGTALPLTIDVESAEEMELRHDWLRALPEIQFVDVVCVYFDQVDAIFPN